MSPWFHPNFPFETLLQWTNHHESCQSLSLSEDIFPSSFKQAFVQPLLKKPSLSADDLNNFRPISNLNFLSKILEKVVATHIQSHLSSLCLLLFNLLTRSFILLKLLFSKFTMTSSLRWIVVRSRHSFFSIYLLLLLLLIIPSFSLVFEIDLVLMVFCLIGSHLISHLALRQSQSMIPNLHSLLFPVVYPKIPYLAHFFLLSILLLLARWSQKIPSNTICTLMTPSCTSLSLLQILLYLLKLWPPLSLTFFPGWNWTLQNINTSHQHLKNYTGFQSNKFISITFCFYTIIWFTCSFHSICQIITRQKGFLCHWSMTLKFTRPKKNTWVSCYMSKKIRQGGVGFFLCFFLFVYLNMILEYICIFYISKLT